MGCFKFTLPVSIPVQNVNYYETNMHVTTRVVELETTGTATFAFAKPEPKCIPVPDPGSETYLDQDPT
jgi:hypothetical protein